WIGADAKATSPKVIAAMEDKSPAVRRKAAYALGRISPNPKDALSALLKALDDANHDVRMTAADAVAAFGADAVPGIIKILEKPAPKLDPKKPVPAPQP